MKKRRKVGVWLLIFMLVLTQISLPGARVQANGNDVSAVAMTEDEADSKEKAEEGTTAAKSKSTEAESNKTPEKTDASDEEKSSESSEKTEKTTSAEEETDKKDAAEEENKEKNDKTESGESVKKTESDSEKQTEEEKDKTDSETEKAPDQSTEGTENNNKTVGTDETVSTAKAKSAPNAAVKDDNQKTYQVKIQPLNKDGDDLSGASITLEASTNTGVASSWSSVDPVDGQYQLTEKDGENVCYYRFSITATGYYQFVSEKFSFTEDDNPYFKLSEIEDGKVTINAEMEKKPDQYRVTIVALDESGKKLNDAVISMTWREDIYWTYYKDSVAPGVYELDVQDKSQKDIYYFYTFTINAEGYTEYKSKEFCFNSRWWNPYFNADTVSPSFTITVQLTSIETTLANAKANAINELNNYKKMENYRSAEQLVLQGIIDEWTKNINNLTIVDYVSTYLGIAKKRMDAVKTDQEYVDEEYRQRIYFQTSSGHVYTPNAKGVVTITNIDEGNFYIKHPDGSLYTNDGWNAKWRCVNEYQHPDDPSSTGFDIIVGTYGQFGAKYVGTYDATVTLSDLGRDIHFTVNVIDGGITELRAYVDGNKVSGQTIHVMGSERKTARIEGRVGLTDQWISIPAHALKYSPGGSTSMNNVTAEFRTWGTSGSITYSLDAKRSVNTTVYIEATLVHPTGVKVVCPSKATVGDWNGALNQYVGIMEGMEAGRYHVVVTPDNASNPGVTWEDLTPDVATFQTLHAAGIVPKKAGTAKFKVSCVENPSINTTVSILFQYEKPLKTAEAEKDVYYAKTSDKSIGLTIITNDQKDSAKGASEQRFNWTYSTAGVVKVTDAVHYDKTSVTIPNWFSHTISILGEGTVYVTGTPYDTTENCKPVKFKVVVSSDSNKDKEAAERVEKLILAIGKVTLEKKGQIQNARAAFQALTTTQKGLVDDDIYAILVAAELELRRLERQNADEEPGGDGGDSSEGNGTGSDSGGTGTGDPSGGTGGDGLNSSGGDGIGYGESGVGDDSTMAGTGDQSAADAAAHKNAVARRRTNSPAVVQSKTTNNTDTSAGKKAGTKGNGKKFYEIDIQDIPKEVMEIVDSISPETKIAVAVCVLIAFIYGFMRRRRQHLSEETEQTLYKE